MCAAKPGEVGLVIVAMSAMMKNNPARKTMLNVTVFMMTTITTVLHRDFENDWSNSHLSAVQFVCIQGVLDGVLVSVVTPSLKGGCVCLPLQRCSVKSFHTGLRVSLFAHALLIMLLNEASAPRSIRNMCLCAESK